MCDASEHIYGENGTQYVPFWHSPRCAPQRKPWSRFKEGIHEDGSESVVYGLPALWL